MTTRREARPTGDQVRKSFAISLIVLSAILVAIPAWSGSNHCIQAEVQQSVRMPHGEQVGPGMLRICREKLSPVSHLHRTVVDGHPVALLISQTRPTEGMETAQPAIVFHRVVDGSLDLVGYVLPGRKGGTAHWFVPHGRTDKTNVRVSEPQILIAAALD